MIHLHSLYIQKWKLCFLNEYRGVTEATSVARGMLATVERFSFLFCIFVPEHFFRYTKLSCLEENLCSVEAKKYGNITLAHLNEECSDEHFDSL